MITAPAHWNLVSVRGCAVCVYGRRADGLACKPDGLDADLCTCPNVAGGRGPICVQKARAHCGPCGPEAAHIAFRGLLS